MKKPLFLILTLLLARISFSQEILANTKDEFTGERNIVVSTKLDLENATKFSIAATTIKSGNTYDTAYGLFVTFKPDDVCSIDSKQHVILKLRDQSIISKSYVGKFALISPYDVASSVVMLDDETLSKIVKAGVAKIRVETSDKNYDFDVLGISENISRLVVTAREMIRKPASN